MNLLERMSAFHASASWAVWGSARPSEPFTRNSDISLPPEAHEVVHGRAILVGLNPGNAAAARPMSGWANFHAGPKHNDHLIAEAFRATPYWGAYMTDLHRQIESNSSLVRPGHDVVAGDVQSLFEQLRLLEPDPLLICFGADTFTRLTRHATWLATKLGLEQIRTLRILHYSGVAAGHHKNRPETYRALVHGALRDAGLPCCTEH